MTEQITTDHAFIYDPLDTYLVDFVSEFGFKLDYCKAKTREEAGLLIRNRYRNHKDFQIRSIEVSNRSLDEIKSLD
ncbi:hypothetical protein [Bacillus pseudomycoides]|uniref:hypothetical protein n=1 Tax=Bacillus pseudomycoides TaxID=64104 RepID=UPI000BF4088F|nr:hypothetical protein [Bacillus pseudomycoides]MED1539115.1 hypothetical protein [Bacillus pseudomycoides]PGC41446.1 hypothetical protein COM18_11070 [Bacillus pseudomycoides]